MVGLGGSSAGSYLADPTSPIPSHCASIIATNTLRVKFRYKKTLSTEYLFSWTMDGDIMMGAATPGIVQENRSGWITNRKENISQTLQNKMGLLEAVYAVISQVLPDTRYKIFYCPFVYTIIHIRLVLQKVYNNIIYISIRYKHRNYKLYKLNCFAVPSE